jgi:hypothetical protein
MPQVPLLKDAGETFMNGSAVAQINSIGGEAQFAYSPVNHWLVNSEATFLVGEKTGLLGDDLGSGNALFVSGGGGYYHFIPKNPNTTKGTHLMLLGGIGVGKTRHKYHKGLGFYGPGTYEVGNSSVSFIRAYVQPSIGYVSDEFELAFNARIVQLHYYQINFTENREYGEWSDQVKLNAKKNPTYFEPGLTLRVGDKARKLQMQLTYIPGYHPLIGNVAVGAGFCFHLGQRQ